MSSSISMQKFIFNKYLYKSQQKKGQISDWTVMGCRSKMNSCNLQLLKVISLFCCTLHKYLLHL
jgi:hypothetical protein